MSSIARTQGPWPVSTNPLFCILKEGERCSYFPLTDQWIHGPRLLSRCYFTNNLININRVIPDPFLFSFISLSFWFDYQFVICLKETIELEMF